jgi:MFS family permease
MPPANASADLASDAPPIPLGAAWYGIAVLTLVTLFAGVDRQVFILLADPVSEEMQLSNFQLGLLQGLGVSIFSVVATYPIAWLADRHDRRWVMSGCILVWSLSVVACGLASGFTQLFIGSAMVGAGAAGLAPIVYSLIPEIFSRQHRQMANSIYTVATTAGGGLAIALCGQVIGLADVIHPALPMPLPTWGSWRVALFLAAAPGPLFILMMLSMRIPRRTHRARPAVGTPQSEAPEGRVGLLPYARQNFLTIGTFAVGVGLPILSFSATVVWLPLIAIRQFGATQVEVGNRLGLAVLLSAVLGWLVTVYLVPLGKPRFGLRLPIMAIAISAVLCGICLAGLVFATSTDTLFLIYGVFATFAAAGSMVYPTALQELAPSHLRARVVALIGIAIFVFVACGPIIVGAISDQLKARPDGLLLSLVGVDLVALVSGGIMLAICSRHVVATITAANAAEAAAA